MIRFWLFFALRGLVRRRSRSAITLGAILLGVGILTFLGATMVGVNDGMIENSVALGTGHLLVRSEDARGLAARWRERQDLPSVVRAALPRLLAPVLLTNEERTASAPVRLAGVLPELEHGVTAISARQVAGEYLAERVAPGERGEVFDVFLGSGAAEALSVETGDSLHVVFGDGAAARGRVTGVFRTGIEQFDRGLAHARLDALAAVETETLEGEVALFLRAGTPSREALRRIEPLLAPGESAAPWQELLAELDQLIRLNGVSMGIVIVLGVVLMAAGVSNTVLVSVMDRYRDFGVLKALGVTPGEILRLIVLESALMCLAAGLLGLAVGSAVTLHFGRTGIDLSRFTSENIHFVMDSVVRPRLTWGMALAPALAVLGAGVAAALWPAWIASRRRAAEVMRLST